MDEVSERREEVRDRSVSDNKEQLAAGQHTTHRRTHTSSVSCVTTCNAADMSRAGESLLAEDLCSWGETQLYSLYPSQMIQLKVKEFPLRRF